MTDKPAKTEVSRLADAHSYGERIARDKQRVRIGDSIRVEDKVGKVVAMTDYFVVLRFTFHCPFWESPQGYNESFRWGEITI